MKKILPSDRISNEISELLEQGCEESDDFLSVLIRKSVKKIIQETLEQEISDYLGRDYYNAKLKPERGIAMAMSPKALRQPRAKL